MIQDIFFTFTCRGKSIVIRYPEYGIVNYEGIEATDYEIVKQENVNYYGENKRRKKLLSRMIPIEFDYLGTEDQKLEKRQELIAFFSPFHAGELTVNYMGDEKRIEYEVIGFTSNNPNIHDKLSFLLELECLDPMFKDIIRTGDQIATWVRGWKFKFTLPFKLKERGEPRKTIINSGHVETPVQIEFHGPAVNPKITNLTTGEFIRIKQELTSDDVLYIDTAFGEKKVEIERNGIKEDAFDYLDLESSFFELQVGDNVIEYESENGLDPQAVQIYYHNRYLGV